MSQNIQLWVELEFRFYEKIQNIDNQINWLGQHIEFSRRLAFSILQSMALKKKQQKLISLHVSYLRHQYAHLYADDEFD